MRLVYGLIFLCGLVACDADKDGIPAKEDCNDEDGTMPQNDADCDGVLTDEDCDDNDSTSTTLATDADCDSVLTADDCNDNNSFSTTVATDADCDGVLTTIDCNDANFSMPLNDADCDGVVTSDDCNDNDPLSTTRATDADCDSVLTADDCDDNNALSTTVATDGDCDGIATADDCNDEDASVPLNDADCDSVLTADDCDDNDPFSTTLATDADCDGVLTEVDCDDNDPTVGGQSTDFDCDGVNNIADVLLIWDENNTPTASLQTSLENAGLTVALSDTNESLYDGTNPSPQDFATVIHLNGTTYQNKMLTTGQQALVDFVYDGGGYIHTEWNAYQINQNQMMLMRDLILFDRTSGSEGVLTWDVNASEINHPVLNGIPSSFSFDGGMNEGTVHPFSIDPSVVLMTASAGDMVAVREFGMGRIVGFAHAANYSSYETLLDPNIQQLFVNAAIWTME